MSTPALVEGHAPDSAWWPIERALLRHYGVLAAVVVAMLVVDQLWPFGLDLLRWDWLFVSGVLTLVLTLRMALALPDRAEQAVQRLAVRGALTDQDDADTPVGRTTAPDGPAPDGRPPGRGVAPLCHRLHAEARRLTVPWAALLAALMATAWLVARGHQLAVYLPTALGETVGAALAGLFVGRAVTYGMLGRRIRQEGLRLTPDPQDFDGAAGLRPVGQLYLFQASILAVPAGFLAAWWFLIPAFGTRYDAWRDVYLGLLAVVLVLEGLAFAGPMVSFHAMMRLAKAALLDDLDRRNQEAVALRATLGDPEDPGRDAAAARLQWLQSRYEAIEGMPTWPVDVSIRRRFTVNNLLLLLPMVTQALGLKGPWTRLLEGLSSLQG